MRRTVMIGNIPVEMVGNAATPIRFKHLFGEDLIRHMNSDEDDAERTEVLMRLAFLMAMQAEKVGGELQKLKESDFIAWLERFEYPALVNATVDALALYLGMERGDLEAAVEENHSKNAVEEQGGNSTLPCSS